MNRCRRCFGSTGWREVAWHHLDAQDRAQVDVYAVACDCELGEWWRQRRGAPLEGKDEGPRASGVRLDDFTIDLRTRSTTLRVIVDPTGEERDGIVRTGEAKGAVLAQLREWLAAKDRPRYPARREWTGGEPEREEMER